MVVKEDLFILVPLYIRVQPWKGVVSFMFASKGGWCSSTITKEEDLSSFL